MQSSKSHTKTQSSSLFKEDIAETIKRLSFEKLTQAEVAASRFSSGKCVEHGSPNLTTTLRESDFKLSATT